MVWTESIEILDLLLEKRKQLVNGNDFLHFYLNATETLSERLNSEHPFASCQ